MKIKKVLKVRKVMKVKEVTKVKFPVRDYSRLAVLLEALKSKALPLGKEVNLATLRIKGKLFSEIISSRPFIGVTTRAGLRAEGFKVEGIKVNPDNKKLYSVIKVTK